MRRIRAAMALFRERGIRVFLAVWAGQVVSLLGSELTHFALGVWVYQETGSATYFALIAMFSVLPETLLLPLVGVLVDRWDRRWAMILGDTGAGLCTLVIAALVWSGRFELWHLYLLVAIGSAFNALQWPAFSASTTLLVPKKHYARASGLTEVGTGAASILAPVVAGVLVVTIGLGGVILIDVVTFLFAVGTLLAVRIPRPAPSAEGSAERGSLWREATYGWTYLRRRHGLMALMGFIAFTNLLMGIVEVLVTPLVLSFTSAEVLGVVLSIGGVGFLAGSVVLSVWGGPRRRVVGILVFSLLQGLILFLGGLQPSAALVAVAVFVFLFGNPLINGCSQAIWQAKVAPDIQGRVFAFRRLIAYSALPLAYLLAGPLADRVFEPLLMPDGALAASVGRLIGVGPGRGIGLLFMLLGALVVLVVAVSWLSPRLRRLEDELPDAVHDDHKIAKPAAEALAAG